MTSRLSSAYDSGKTGLDLLALAKSALEAAEFDFKHQLQPFCDLPHGPARVYWITTYELRLWELNEQQPGEKK